MFKIAEPIKNNDLVFTDAAFQAKSRPEITLVQPTTQLKHINAEKEAVATKVEDMKKKRDQKLAKTAERGRLSYENDPGLGQILKRFERELFF